MDYAIKKNVEDTAQNVSKNENESEVMELDTKCSHKDEDQLLVGSRGNQVRAKPRIKKNRLVTSARNYLKFLLVNGVPKQQARIEAKKPKHERIYFEKGTPSESIQNRFKVEAQHASTPGSCKEDNAQDVPKNVGNLDASSSIKDDDVTPVSNRGKKRKNSSSMPGSARRRFHILVNRGVPVKEARIEAMKPTEKQFKSSESVQFDVSRSNNKIPKRFIEEVQHAATSISDHGVLFTQAMKEVKGVSLSRNYPQKLLTKNQIEAVDNIIVKNDDVLPSSSRENDDRKEHRNSMLLSGAARERFKFLLQNGVPVKEARIKALKPIEPFRSDVSTSNEWVPKRFTDDVQHAATSISGHGETFIQARTDVKMAILSRNYPEELLTTEQIKAVDDIIMKIVAEEGYMINPRPSFLQHNYGPGWFNVTCANVSTARWLKSIEGKIKPWRGANLVVLEEADMPHHEILIGYLPSSQDYSNEKILQIFGGLNNLRVSNWKILRRNPFFSSLEVVISADRLSVEELKRQEYWVNYRYGRIQFRVKGCHPHSTD